MANVATGSTTGPILVTVNGVNNTGSYSFEVPTPTITSVSPPEAPAGGTVTIIGTGFGGYDYNNPVNHILFNALDGNIISWTDTSITTQVPLLKGFGSTNQATFCNGPSDCRRFCSCESLRLQ